MALVKIPIIVEYVESETKVSGAHKVKPLKLKKGKVIPREPSMFLFNTAVRIFGKFLLHYFTNSFSSLVILAILISCLSGYVLSL